MSWRFEEMARLQERQKLLEQPLDPIAVTARVLAMFSSVLPSKPVDWDGYPMHVRSISWRKVEGATRAYVDGVDLIEAAATNRNAWDEAARFAAQNIDKGEAVPEFLRVFTAEVLRGVRPRPACRGRPADPNRNFAICLGLEALSRAGIKPTRNEATEDVQSGCDILAATLGRDTSAYVDIWKLRKKHLYAQSSWELHLERLLVGD